MRAKGEKGAAVNQFLSEAKNQARKAGKQTETNAVQRKERSKKQAAFGTSADSAAGSVSDVIEGAPTKTPATQPLLK